MTSGRLRLVLFLSSLGVFVAGFLSLAHLGGFPIPCGGSNGCDLVASHPLSAPFGVPIAYVGFFGYVSIFGLAYWTAQPQPGLFGLRLLTTLGLMASMGLVAAARFVIHATCTWCLASALIMAVLAWLSWFAAPPPGVVRERSIWLAFPVAAIGAAWLLSSRAEPMPPHDALAVASVPISELATDESPSRGPTEAGVWVVEFADFACPACKAMHRRLAALADSRQVRLVFRNLVLNRLPGHEASARAAVLGEICHETGKFWDFADSVFAMSGSPSDADLDRLASALAPKSSLQSRLGNAADPAYLAVNRDMTLAKRLGLSETPTYILVRQYGSREVLGPRALIAELDAVSER